MKIGIIGCGKIAKEVHITVIKAIPDIQIEWFCDKSILNARELRDIHAPQAKVYESLDQCSDVDVVLITVPVGIRRKLVLDSINRGFHVFCEKPFAMNYSEHIDYLEKASKASVCIGVGMIRRYFRTTRLVKDLVESGVFGEIKGVWASQSNRVIRTGRKDIYQADKNFSGGGVLMETGVHLIDQVFAMLNVTKYKLKHVEKEFIGDLDYGVTASSVIAMANGAETTFNLELSNKEDLFFGISLLMEKAIIKVGLFANSDVVLCDLQGLPLCKLNGQKGVGDIFQAFYSEWVDFLNQCRSMGKIKSDISADSVALTAKFIDDCYNYDEK
jgi:predicted dehydrogenase